jgi:hypothetical protein
MKAFIYVTVFVLCTPFSRTVGQNEEASRTDVFFGGANSVNYTPYLQVSVKRQFQSRLHVALGYGYRPVQNISHNASVSVGYTLKRWFNRTLYIKSDLSFFKRSGASQIVDTEWIKHSIGCGYWMTLVSRLSMQIEINPLGFYYGTYRDKPSPRIGPSVFEGEIKLGVGFQL